MMMNLKKLNAAIFILLSASSLHVSAQNAGNSLYNPSWYLVPFATHIDPADSFLQGSDKNGWGGGLRLGKEIAPSWDMQLGGGYTRTHDNGNNYREATLGVDALYMFSRSHFQPFLLAGIGAQYDKMSTNYGYEAAKTSPYLNLGAGLRYAINDQWGIQADIRRQRGWLRSDDFGFKRSNNTLVNVGLTYAFGRIPLAAAVIAPVVAAVIPPQPRIEKTTLSAKELFAFDSDKLRMPQPKLEEMAALLGNSTGGGNIAIAGYTDRLGSDAYNQGLSQRRANAVKTYLASRGVPADRITAVGRGKSNPVSSCGAEGKHKNTKAARAAKAALIACLEPDRRVEIEPVTIERQVP